MVLQFDFVGVHPASLVHGLGKFLLVRSVDQQSRQLEVIFYSTAFLIQKFLCQQKIVDAN